MEGVVNFFKKLELRKIKPIVPDIKQTKTVWLGLGVGKRLQRGRGRGKMDKQEWSHNGNFSESKYWGDYQSWIFKNVLFENKWNISVSLT